VVIMGEADLPGRARELAALELVLEDDEPGEPRCIHLVGEAGIGKSTLAQRAAARATAEGWLVAWGRAWDSPAAPPYLAWQHVLGALARGTGLAKRGNPSILAGLAELVPELAPAEPVGAPTVDDPERARVALHRAVLHALQTAVLEVPVVLVLDDMHAADPATIELATLTGAARFTGAWFWSPRAAPSPHPSRLSRCWPS
jgi:hypothetical protein